VVTASVPLNVTITSEGPSTAQTPTDALTTLITAIDGRNSTGEVALTGNAQRFLTSLSASTSLDVRTIVPTVSTGVRTNDPIVITGSSGSAQSEAFVIDMRELPGSVLQLENIEFASIIGAATVNGGSGNNYAVGDDSAQFISLGVGDDTLFGGEGADTIGSGAGNDVLYGNQGADTVFGGTDSDTVFGGQDADVVYGNEAADVMYGNLGDDTLYGGQDGDLVYGGEGHDLLHGNLGNDTLSGNAGDDVIYGGAGEDWIATGDGSDSIAIASGGGNDTVADFDGAAGDRILIEANANGTTIDTFDDLSAAARDDGSGNVVIALGEGNSLTLVGVSSSELQSDWIGLW
jgi:Ca2+-binding RTX toxin-like protein